MYRLKWLLVSAAILSIAMLAARQVGAQAPESAAVAWLKSLYTPECALPRCWQGIRVGETTVRQALELLQADGTWQVELLQSPSYGTWVVRSYRQVPPQGIGVGIGGLPDEPIVANQLWIHLPEGTLRIGEVIAALGIPDWAWLCRVGSPAFYRIGEMRFMTQSTRDGRFSPHAHIISMNVSTNTRRDEPPWQGFTHRTRPSVAIQRACR
ncbi:MAG: hypothetical protein RML95_03215 [Anaerolineae bacterium]|nr:hypothetical protein [Anaerolineae bacterium]MDW8298326.1 hypothetical protein [Anaerolineae bacterium]